MDPSKSFTSLVQSARAGDLAAFERLVEETRAGAYAAAFRVLRTETEARDALQDAYVRAFQRLVHLTEPEAFAGWLRRIVVTVAVNRLRLRRMQWVPLDEREAPPLLDEEERQWSETQQRLLARALLKLSRDERRLCELHYHGGWSADRIAEHCSWVRSRFVSDFRAFGRS